ncbi:MAG: hypothetical protein ABR529_06085 [Actinomycetota bacterium]
MRRDEDPNRSNEREGDEDETPPTGQEIEGERGDDQEAMEPDLGSAG